MTGKYKSFEAYLRDEADMTLAEFNSAPREDRDYWREMYSQEYSSRPFASDSRWD